MSKGKKRYYVVVRGQEPGVYEAWPGEHGAARQVIGFEGALHRAFHSQEAAAAWLRELRASGQIPELPPALSGFLARQDATGKKEAPEDLDRGGMVLVYTDGAAIGNPGPGGYGIVLRYDGHRRELSGGYRLTTNNRMELMACIKALEALKFHCSVVLYSDSRYVVDGITKGWAERWRAAGWRRNERDKAENVDLWSRLLDLRERHEVDFRWVRGHTGNPDNERCDELATRAAGRRNLPPDRGYEAGETHRP
ncbi:MAG: ribonuclease HI [Anaerolineae bacterium]